MSEKRLDAKNRWRNVVVAFRMSPEEAQELNVQQRLPTASEPTVSWYVPDHPMSSEA